jgi:hypothetical protein
MYNELIKDLREWPRVCVEHTGSLDELHDKAADAIEELQKRVPKRPHGRLVDADRLGLAMMDAANVDQALAMVDDAPTIIQAEEGET